VTVGPAMAAALARNRERLNARLRLAVRGGARLAPEAVLAHLADSVGPVVEAVAAFAP